MQKARQLWTLVHRSISQSLQFKNHDKNLGLLRFFRHTIFHAIITFSMSNKLGLEIYIHTRNIRYNKQCDYHCIWICLIGSIAKKLTYFLNSFSTDWQIQNSAGTISEFFTNLLSKQAFGSVQFRFFSQTSQTLNACIVYSKAIHSYFCENWN